jgi:hypothetical protein
MFTQQFRIETRHSVAFTMVAMKAAFPVPTSGSWPAYAESVDLVSHNSFRAFVVRAKMWPFVISATFNQEARKGTFCVQLHDAAIFGAACVFILLLIPALWLTFANPMAVPWDDSVLLVLWPTLFATVVFFAAQVWWHARCIGKYIRQVVADERAA